MKNLIAINGSPRKNWNTAQLLQHAVKGAEDAGASTEIINLYTLNFKGCTSCFACKLKSRPHGSCAMKDDLSPVLEKIKNADAIIFGTPIYFMNLSAGMIAFIERLFFSNYIYSDEIPTVSKIIRAMKVQSSTPKKKFAYKEKHFAEDCQAAYEIGRDLILK